MSYRIISEYEAAILHLREEQNAWTLKEPDVEGKKEKSYQEKKREEEREENERDQNFWENEIKLADPNYAEVTKVVEECKENITALNVSITKKLERIAVLRGHGNRVAEIDQLKWDIKNSRHEINTLKQRAVDSKQNYLDDKMNKMQDEGAKKNYDEFVMHSINNLRRNSKIVQYGRVIQAVTYMDAEKVFQVSAMTDSQIVFFNGETLDLLINNELQIHPRAVDQLLIVRGTEENTKSDLQKVMELTQQQTAGTMSRGDYLKNIRLVLINYMMITRTEIEAVKQQINSQYRNMPEGELRSRLKSLTPAEAYRMRTVLRDAPKDCLQLAAKMAERYGNTSIHTLAAFAEIAKRVIIDAIGKGRCDSNAMSMSMSIEDWSDFYKTRQQKEIAGMICDGVEESVAEQKAAEHFTKLMKAKEAELNFRRTKEACKQNPSGVSAEELEAATTRMYIAKKDIDVKEAKYHSRYHDQTPHEWLQKRNTGTSTINYISELLENEKAFNSKWAEIIEEITEAEKWLKEDLAFHSSVDAYYHLLKHGDDTRHYSNALSGESKGPAHNSDLYFKSMKNIFDANMKDGTVISQDGQQISTIYRDQNGYFGVTKCAYDVHLGSQIGTASVATHFLRPQKIKKKRQQATRNQQSDEEDSDVMSNLKTCSSPVQSTPMLDEEILEGIDVETMKRKIFSDLSLLLTGSDLVSGHGIVRLLFSLCRHANQSSVHVRTYFTADEQTKLDAQLIEAIPHFHRNVREKALVLGEESLMRLRTVRSGIQFLSDDLATTGGPDLYFAISDFMESPAVFDLDKKLKIFEGMRGQYDCDCEDLRGVPDSHFWWSELERGDSEQKFGK